MRYRLVPVLMVSSILYGCVSDNAKFEGTIGGLTKKTVQIEPKALFKIDRQQVIESYRALVEITPDGVSNGDELRRLSDLELEASLDNKLSGNVERQQTGQEQSLSAIWGYEDYLIRYPNRDDNDKILYQLSRAYALELKPQQSLRVLDRLARDFPESQFIDEVQFRRGENLFVMRQFAEAEAAYGYVVKNRVDSRFYEKALYKFGWTQFKQSRYQDAIDSYIALLDLNAVAGNVKEINLSKKLNRADQELLGDAVRVISLAFSYEAKNVPMRTYFARVGRRSYEPLLYLGLGNLYLRKGRIIDASDIFLAYAQLYPYSRYTPEFHQKAIDIYQQAGYASLVLDEKIDFINRYDVGSEFWKRQSIESQNSLTPALRLHLRDLATHFHAMARVSRKVSDYQISAGWYRRFLKSFPRDNNAAEINFLLAESLFDARQYASSIDEYEITAYQYDAHKYNAEAGYAALLAYDKLIKASNANLKKSLLPRRVKSAWQFVQAFPADKRVSAVLLQMAQYYYARKEYLQAIQVANLLIENPQANRTTQQSAWTIIAHAHYTSGEFGAAEKAYLKLLPYLPAKSKQTTDIREQIAASIYKQGEDQLNAGNYLLAANLFLRLGRVIPESQKRVVADYDAATAYIELEDWPRAISLLEAFRKRYPKNKTWKVGVSEKLALAYSKNGNQALAAREMIAMSTFTQSRERKRDLMWRAAELYQEAGRQTDAISIYKKYVKQYPSPIDRSIELRYRIAEFYRQKNQSGKLQFWLKEIVRADANARAERNPRSKYLAAIASMELIKPVHRSYQTAKLTIPLKRSLKKKKKLMQLTIDGYTRAMKYQVAEVTTEATYQLAEIYNSFARSLLESQRPGGLNEEELEEYELLLEEQAYPFEEKTIEIHLANFKRIPVGIYDQSIKRSLKVLGKLLPYRYAKVEQTDSYVELP